MEIMTGRKGAVQLNDDDGGIFYQVSWIPAGALTPPTLQEMATARGWKNASGETKSEAVILAGGGA